jgi:hypothetical protein
MDIRKSGLRFVDAVRLDTSAGRLDNVLVVTPTRIPVGKLDGVIVDPSRLQVEYLVVGSRFKSRHYLVPMRTARLAGDAHELQIDIDSEQIGQLEAIDLRRCPTLSPGDLGPTGTHDVAA